MKHQIYVIYVDGLPLKTTGRNAYEREGSAKSKVTTMVNQAARMASGRYHSKDNPEYIKAATEARTRFEIIPYSAQ
jgi:hypothetical protein